MGLSKGELSGREGNAVALMILSAVAFSGLAPLSVLTSDLSESGLLFIACIVAALVHLPFLRWRKLRTEKIKSSHVIEALAGGAIVTLAYVLFAYAIRLSQNAFLPTLVFELYPLGLLIFSVLLLAPERFSGAQMFWIFTSIIGVFSLTLDRQEIGSTFWSADE